jgi:2-polyprenyl-3-methyl-5-hydroxy-6-metoxy-1,4-benzoquinol methylase
MMQSVRILVSPFIPNWLRQHRRQRIKERVELAFWQSKRAAEKTLTNAHYEFFYTSAFGMTRDNYRGKRVLDIGCGPRGSLEWADMAAQRVGLDPLVKKYKDLGIDQHAMEYVCSPSEKIPFSDGHFDTVTSLNSLDHVNDLDTSLSEIARVLRHNGVFLLLVEVNHKPTTTEPVTIHPGEFGRSLARWFDVEQWQFFLMSGVHSYDVVRTSQPVTADPGVDQPAFLVARLRKARN